MSKSMDGRNRSVLKVDILSKIKNTSSPSGRHYKSRLLDLLMPLLSPLITSHRLLEPKEMEIYVSCLALLSDFTDDKGSFWRLREDAKRHPKLEAPLRDKLRELENSQYIGLSGAATEALKKTLLDAEESDAESMTMTMVDV